MDVTSPSLSDTDDLAEIESVPLESRDLPGSTFAVVERAAQLWPERTALTLLNSASRRDSATSLTFGHLAYQVRASANVFIQRRIDRADTVTLISRNTGSLLAATLAAEAAGIAAPVNPDLSEDLIIAMMRSTGSRIIVTSGPELDADVFTKVRSICQRHAGIEAIFALRPDGAEGRAPQLDNIGPTRVVHLEEEITHNDGKRLLAPPPSAQSIASYFHTGGTTGQPKLAAHTHFNEVAMAWMLAATSALIDPSTILAGLPLFHVNALLVTGLTPMMRGHTTLWLGPAGFRDPALYQNFWKIVERHHVNAMSAVPTVYAALASVPVDADIHTMHVAAVGAAPLPARARDQFRARTGIELTEGYGLTEATCASASSRHGLQRPGSVGRRLPYQRIAAGALGEDGQWHPQPAGSVGQLMISGPNVFPGYLVDGNILSLDARQGEWLLTGDRGCVDEDGFVYLKGRAKDLIIRGGHNIDPTVIEDALTSHPGVSAAAVVGRPDTHSGEVPVAFVVAADDVTDEDLMQWAHDTITERAAVPKTICRLEVIPTTAVGKPFKVPLRERAAVEALQAQLASVGISEPSITAHHRGATLTLTVQAVTDPQEQAKIRAVAEAFSFQLEFLP